MCLRSSLTSEDICRSEITPDKNEPFIIQSESTFDSDSKKRSVKSRKKTEMQRSVNNQITESIDTSVSPILKMDQSTESPVIPESDTSKVTFVDISRTDQDDVTVQNNVTEVDGNQDIDAIPSLCVSVE
jgi:hypothetical protein